MSKDVAYMHVTLKAGVNIYGRESAAEGVR